MSDEQGRTKTYVVTDRAGPRVAGRVVEREQDLELTDAEADYELREGTIALKGKAEQKRDRAPKSDRAREESAAARTAAGAPGVDSASTAA